MRSTSSKLFGIVVLLLTVTLVGYATTMARDPSPSNPDARFIVSSVRVDGTNIEVSLAINRMGAELMTDPILVMDDTRVAGRFSTSADGRNIVASFSDVRIVDGSGGVSLELPAVTAPVSIRTETGASLGYLNGPGGETYRILSREVDESSGILSIVYAPDDSGAPSIAFASIVGAAESIDAVGVSTVHDSSNSLERGTIEFPLRSTTLLDEEGASIVIHEFRDVTSESYTLPIPVAE